MADYRLHTIVSLMAALSLSAPQIRVGVEGVRVDVLVTDRNAPVQGLTAADFEVRDNGVLQKIHTASIDDDPIDTLLVLDTSVSVEGQPLRHLKSSGGRVDLDASQGRPIRADHVLARDPRCGRLDRASGRHSGSVGADSR